MEYFFQNAPYPTQLEKLVKSCSYLFPIRPERARGASKFVVQPDPTHGRAGLRDRAPIPADRSTPRALRPCEKTSGLKHPRRLAIRQLYDGVRDLLLRGTGVFAPPSQGRSQLRYGSAPRELQTWLDRCEPNGVDEETNQTKCFARVMAKPKTGFPGIMTATKLVEVRARH
jgi:hypothetical protein